MTTEAPTSAREKLIEQQQILVEAITDACNRFEENTGLFVTRIEHPRAGQGNGDKIAVGVKAPGL